MFKCSKREKYERYFTYVQILALGLGLPSTECAPAPGLYRCHENTGYAAIVGSPGRGRRMRVVRHML
jgi:hypothetical protein